MDAQRVKSISEKVFKSRGMILPVLLWINPVLVGILQIRGEEPTVGLLLR